MRISIPSGVIGCLGFWCECLLTWVRALQREHGGTSALASDDAGVIGGQAEFLSDEHEAGVGHVSEVYDDDGVLVQVHCLLDCVAGVDEFCAAEVADEYRVLQSISLALHDFADASQAAGFTNVVGDEVASAGDTITSL